MTHHAATRAQERYGMELTAEIRKEIYRQIDQKKGVLQAIKRNGTEIWLVKLPSGILPVVFNRAAGNIVTILPPNGKTSRP
jgi:hypothetical protein